jgi:hypothetical protein
VSAPDPKQALAFALEKYPERVEAIPLAELAVESARANDKRPAWVKLMLPDEAIKGLRGTEGDLYLMVRVPKDVVGRSESSILLPGEVR